MMTTVVYLASTGAGDDAPPEQAEVALPEGASAVDALLAFGSAFGLDLPPKPEPEPEPEPEPDPEPDAAVETVATSSSDSDDDWDTSADGDASAAEDAKERRRLMHIGLGVEIAKLREGAEDFERRSKIESDARDHYATVCARLRLWAPRRGAPEQSEGGVAGLPLDKWELCAVEPSEPAAAFEPGGTPLLLEVCDSEPADPQFPWPFERRRRAAMGRSAWKNPRDGKLCVGDRVDLMVLQEAPPPEEEDAEDIDLWGDVADMWDDDAPGPEPDPEPDMEPEPEPEPERQRLQEGVPPAGKKASLRLRV